MGADPRNEEAAVRRLIEDWASAVRAKDLGGVVARHTDDVLMFDVPPPRRCAGFPPIGRRGRRSSRR